MGDPLLDYFALLILIFVVAVLLYGTAYRNQGQRPGPIRGGFRRQDRATTAARVAN